MYHCVDSSTISYGRKNLGSPSGGPKRQSGITQNLLNMRENSNKNNIVMRDDISKTNVINRLKRVKNSAGEDELFLRLKNTFKKSNNILENQTYGDIIESTGYNYLNFVFGERDTSQIARSNNIKRSLNSFNGENNVSKMRQELFIAECISEDSDINETFSKIDGINFINQTCGIINLCKTVCLESGNTDAEYDKMLDELEEGLDKLHSQCNDELEVRIGKYLKTQRKKVDLSDFKKHNVSIPDQMLSEVDNSSKTQINILDDFISRIMFAPITEYLSKQVKLFFSKIIDDVAKISRSETIVGENHLRTELSSMCGGFDINSNIRPKILMDAYRSIMILCSTESLVRCESYNKDKVLQDTKISDEILKFGGLTNKTKKENNSKLDDIVDNMIQYSILESEDPKIAILKQLATDSFGYNSQDFTNTIDRSSYGHNVDKNPSGRYYFLNTKPFLHSVSEIQSKEKHQYTVQEKSFLKFVDICISSCIAKSKSNPEKHGDSLTVLKSELKEKVSEILKHESRVALNVFGIMDSMINSYDEISKNKYPYHSRREDLKNPKNPITDYDKLVMQSFSENSKIIQDIVNSTESENDVTVKKFFETSGDHFTKISDNGKNPTLWEDDKPAHEYVIPTWLSNNYNKMISEINSNLIYSFNKHILKKEHDFKTFRKCAIMMNPLKSEIENLNLQKKAFFNMEEKLKSHIQGKSEMKVPSQRLSKTILSWIITESFTSAGVSILSQSVPQILDNLFGKTPEIKPETKAEVKPKAEKLASVNIQDIQPGTIPKKPMIGGDIAETLIGLLHNTMGDIGVDDLPRPDLAVKIDINDNSIILSHKYNQNEELRNECKKILGEKGFTTILFDNIYTTEESDVFTLEELKTIGDLTIIKDNNTSTNGKESEVNILNQVATTVTSVITNIFTGNTEKKEDSNDSGKTDRIEPSTVPRSFDTAWRILSEENPESTIISSLTSKNIRDSEINLDYFKRILSGMHKIMVNIDLSIDKDAWRNWMTSLSFNLKSTIATMGTISLFTTVFYCACTADTSYIQSGLVTATCFYGLQFAALAKEKADEFVYNYINDTSKVEQKKDINFNKHIKNDNYNQELLLESLDGYMHILASYVSPTDDDGKKSTTSFGILTKMFRMETIYTLRECISTSNWCPRIRKGILYTIPALLSFFTLYSYAISEIPPNDTILPYEIPLVSTLADTTICTLADHLFAREYSIDLKKTVEPYILESIISGAVILSTILTNGTVSIGCKALYSKYKNNLGGNGTIFHSIRPSVLYKTYCSGISNRLSNVYANPGNFQTILAYSQNKTKSILGIYTLMNMLLQSNASVNMIKIIPQNELLSLAVFLIAADNVDILESFATFSNAIFDNINGKEGNTSKNIFKTSAFSKILQATWAHFNIFLTFTSMRAATDICITMLKTLNIMNPNNAFLFYITNMLNFLSNVTSWLDLSMISNAWYTTALIFVIIGMSLAAYRLGPVLGESFINLFDIGNLSKVEKALVNEESVIIAKRMQEEMKIYYNYVYQSQIVD